MKGSNVKAIQRDPDMLKEYDFSSGIQGKYAKGYEEGTEAVVIESDATKHFPDRQRHTADDLE